MSLSMTSLDLQPVGGGGGLVPACPPSYQAEHGPEFPGAWVRSAGAEEVGKSPGRGWNTQDGWPTLEHLLCRGGHECRRLTAAGFVSGELRREAGRGCLNGQHSGLVGTGVPCKQWKEQLLLMWVVGSEGVCALYPTCPTFSLRLRSI